MVELAVLGIVTELQRRWVLPLQELFFLLEEMEHSMDLTTVMVQLVATEL